MSAWIASGLKAEHQQRESMSHDVTTSCLLGQIIQVGPSVVQWIIWTEDVSRQQVVGPIQITRREATGDSKL